MSETLPRGWTEAALGEIGIWRGGGTPSKANSSFWSGGEIPWVSPKGMKRPIIDDSEERITGAAVEGSATQLIPEGSVLIVTRSGILRHSLPVAVNARDVAINQDLKALSPLGGIDPTFLSLQLQSLANAILKQCAKSGTTVDSVDFERLKAFRVFISPLPEQRRIVAKIDSLSAKSKRARDHLDRIPRLVEKYKQAILAAAFRGELTWDWRKHQPKLVPVHPRSPQMIKRKFIASESKFSPPYDLPQSWRWLRLPELGDLDRGKSKHRPRNDPRLFGGPYPFIQTGEIRAADRYLTSYSETYNDFGLAQSRLWPTGTLCITIAANIAETALLAFDACFPDSVVGFIADDDKVDASYAEFFLRTVRADLEAFAPATAQKNINLDTLGSVRLPIAPLAEQKEIVRRIDTAFTWIDRLAAEATRARKLIDQLDQSILAKAFRGELVPQDPNDEPASVLLERIRAERQSAVRQRGLARRTSRSRIRLKE